MKKLLYVLTGILITCTTLAQEKEKIKGSKIVKVEIKPTTVFETMDVSDNLEIYLIKGTVGSIEIDADANLHEIVDVKVKGKVLYLSTLKAVTRFKKFVLRITYTSDLQQVLLHNKVKANFLNDIELSNITFKNYDETRLFLNSKSTNFSLFLDDNARAEINIKGEKSSFNLSKNSQLKALVVSNDIFIDQYQNAEAKIEGESNNLKIRLDNSSRFTGKNLVSKSAEITAEFNSRASINVQTLVKIDVSGSSEIDLFGTPKVELSTFADRAILKKMQLK